jgi:CDP-diacylglycerol---serine O-phosphatidyltransferase
MSRVIEPGRESAAAALRSPRSLIREFRLADWLTLANAICGIGAVFSFMSYLLTDDVRHIYLGCASIIAALAFDILDGRIARWRKGSSLLGRELDSLADVISFGVAPAMMAYACGMRGTLDRLLLAYFVACGVARLARFNATAEALCGSGDRVKYFEGTPIPTSVVLVVMMAIAASRGAVREALWLGELSVGGLTLHPLVLVFVLSGSLMISRLRIPKL